MKILHTSDWHLGRTLYGKKRAAEFEAFLDWLLSALDEHEADVLIVAGDIFDTTTPGPLYQQLYYRFLCRAAKPGAPGVKRRHVVIVGGNHDSPSFLDAPKDLLRYLDVHVIGSATECLEDELLTLRGADGEPELLICAVPYLRDRDVRSLEFGTESLQDKERKLLEGIGRHYREAGRLAEKASASLGGVPIVGTGHLFTAGGDVTEGDGVRDLYIGSLARVETDAFPSCFDYTALGHLHSPQKAGGLERVRYSGSPFAMSAKEAAGKQKSVVLVELGNKNKREISVTELPVPVFQEIAYVGGDMDVLSRELTELRLRNESVWAEVVYDGRDGPVADLRDRVMELAGGSKLEILRIRDASAGMNIMGLDALDFGGGVYDIGELDVSDVFRRCMEKRSVAEEDRPLLLDTYQRLLSSVYEGI